jgi:lysozyme family protein
MEAEININFRKAFELVINRYEGKYSNDKDDPGGETYKGIARNMNKDFGGWKIIDNCRGGNNFPNVLETMDTLQGLVMKFYKINYWDKFMGDKIGEKSGIEMFDQSVNLGTGRAVEHLQRSLNILNNMQKLYPDIKADGAMGNQTFEAYKKCCSIKGEIFLVKVLNLFQGKYYIELMEKKEVFEKFTGLLKRVSIIQ